MAVWSFPTRIVFGEGTVDEAGSEARKLGARSALVVSDPGVMNAGLVDRVVRSLEKEGVLSTPFTEVSTHPTEAEVRSATEAYREAGADLVVAVGGGAPMDLAKIVRLASTHTLPLAEYDEAIGGDAKITQPMPPMIALPTTAGTGSEVSQSGVIILAETGKKTVLFSPRLIPDVALLDPTLSVSLPKHLTAATGFGALAHNIEAYLAKGDHPMADAIALDGIEMVKRHLLKAVEEGSDLAARGALLKASMMGAVALQKGLGACRSLSHPLGAEKGLHHGLANALCLPAVLDFNRSATEPGVERRVARIARILGVKGSDVQTLAFECSGAIRAFREKLGLPSGLTEAGVEEGELPRLAGLAMQDASHQRNPRTCTKDDMLALYRASM